MRKMKMDLTNSFHGSQVTLFAVVDDRNLYLSKKQAKRAHAKLCGSADCACGGVFGERPHLTAIPQGADYIVPGYFAE